MKCAVGKTGGRPSQYCEHLRRAESRAQHHALLPRDHVISVLSGNVVKVVPNASRSDTPMDAVSGRRHATHIPNGPPGVVQITQPIPSWAIRSISGLPGCAVSRVQDSSLIAHRDEGSGVEPDAGEPLASQ